MRIQVSNFGRKQDQEMRRKIFRAAFCTIILALGSSTQAQPIDKIPRVGLLVAAANPSDSSRRDAFRQGLHELGYVEGKIF